MSDLGEQIKPVQADAALPKVEGLSQPEKPFNASTLRTEFYTGLQGRLSERLDNMFSGDQRSPLFSAILTQMEKDSEGLLAASANTTELYSYLQRNGQPNFTAHVDMQGFGFDQMQRGVEDYQAYAKEKPESAEKIKKEQEHLEQLRARALIQYSLAFGDIANATVKEGYFRSKYLNIEGMDKSEQDVVLSRWNEIEKREDFRRVQDEAKSIERAVNQGGGLVFRDALTRIETKNQPKRDLSKVEPRTRVFYAAFNELLNRMWWTS